MGKCKECGKPTGIGRYGSGVNCVICGQLVCKKCSTAGICQTDLVSVSPVGQKKLKRLGLLVRSSILWIPLACIVVILPIVFGIGYEKVPNPVWVLIIVAPLTALCLVAGLSDRWLKRAFEKVKNGPETLQESTS